MNTGRHTPFKVRATIFLLLWLLAGAAYATFSEFNVEAGDSMFAARTQMVCLAPLVAAQGWFQEVTTLGNIGRFGRKL
jgi:hypothetical protein